MVKAFCSDPLGEVPVYQTLKHTQVGVVKLLIGVLYFVMMFITIGWVNMNEKKARTTFHPDFTNTVIFPPFVKILWLSAFSNAFIGFLMLFIPVEITGKDSHDNLSISVLLYPIAWALQHFVVEGVAFMLMQKGCGVSAARTAFAQSLVWAFVTFGLQAGVYGGSHFVSMMCQVIWSVVLLIFLFLLWVAPEKRLYRRSACIPYAKFWCIFRIVSLICFVASESKISVLEEMGSCGYVFGPLLFFPILQPLVCYWTLLDDSLWWQGAFLHDVNDDSPLFGIDLNIGTAIALAEVLDHISASKSAKLINFAHIQTEWTLIGQGSFSKVFSGSYKNVPCALKLVYTTDLTAEDVNKATVEATLLSSIRSINIINIFGICVSPPNVIIALELCELGSLYDVLRNENLNLSHSDRMYLSLGCCRGVEALHNLDSSIVHRDIKSMNFLVDSHLNAKLADLELGQAQRKSQVHVHRSEQAVAKFLLNWMAPEFIKHQQYTRPSDIYSLALVLWEVVSDEAPYSHLSQEQIAQHVASGQRPELPPCEPAYQQLLCMGWAQEQSMRPSAGDMAAAMGSIWRGSFYRRFTLAESSSAVSATIEEFLRPERASSLGQRLTVSISEPSVDTGNGLMLSSLRHATNPMLSKYSSCNHNALKSELDDGLERLAKLMSSESSLEKSSWLGREGWRRIRSLADPVLVVSRSSPHIILNASNALGSLLGFSISELFGWNMECFIEEESSAVGAVSGSQSRDPLLRSFYKNMILPGERAHIVVRLRCRDGSTVKCSVSSFPIHLFVCSRSQEEDANDEQLKVYNEFKESLCDDELLRPSAKRHVEETQQQPIHFGLLISRLEKNFPLQRKLSKQFV